MQKETYVENLKRIAGRMQHSKKHDWEKNQHEWLDVEEYQRKEQVMTAVLKKQKRQELLGKLNARKALVKAQR